MKKLGNVARASAILLCMELASPVPAYAAEDPAPKNPLALNAELSFQYLGQQDRDLGSAGAGYQDSFSEQAQVMAGYHFTPNLLGYFHGRALNVDGDTGFQDDTGETTSSAASFLELRQLYLRFENLFSSPPAYLQVGRQRLREPSSLWWNSDQDLIKAGYDSTLFSAFVAGGEEMHSYRTGSNDDFQEADKDRLHIIGEASWQHTYNHFLEARAVYENDHSGIEPVGSFVNADDRDNEDQNLFWAGIRAAGELTDKENHPFIGQFKYRADLMGVAGEEDLLNTAAGPGGFRTVTGSTGRDVRAWAFDGRVIAKPFSGIHAPALTLGYAYGSGEENPAGTDTDSEFRQTDLDGTSSRLGLERNQQSHYGEVLRPELSNIHIAMAGVAVPLSDHTDISATYFNYHLAEDATSHRSSGVTAAMTGTDKDVGQAVDIGFYVDLDDQFSSKLPYTRDIDFRIVAGSFFPGDAYGVNDEDAYRVFSELKFKF